MTARRTVLVTGSDRRGTLCLAASLAVVAASGGRGVLLVELAAEPRRRQTTLLASPRARELEQSLREAGAPAAARGHLCHLGVAVEAGGTERVALLAEPGRRGDRRRQPRPRVLGRGARLRAAAPARRVAAGGAARGPVARGAVRGRAAGPGDGRPRRSARPRPDRGAPRPRRDPACGHAVAARGQDGCGAHRPRPAAMSRCRRPSGRRESGQALPLVLGVAALLIGCALVLASIGGAVTGKARVQRAADLSALSAARSMRDNAVAAARARAHGGRLAQPASHLARGVPRGGRGRGGRGGGAKRRRSAAGPGRGSRCRRDPAASRSRQRRRRDRSVRPPGRGAARLRGRRGGPSGAGADRAGGCGGGRGRPALARGLERGGGDGEWRRLLGAAGVPKRRGDAPGRGGGVRPDGGRGPRSGSRPAGQLGFPLRRGAGRPLRRSSGPALGGAPGALAAPLRNRARPRAPPPRTAGWRRTPSASGSSSATRGRRGTSGSTPARRPARRPGRAVGWPRGPTAIPHGTRCPASFRSASGRRSSAPRRATTSRRRCSPRS